MGSTLKFFILFLSFISVANAANIVEERADENGIYIKASNGKTITITQNDLSILVPNDGLSTATQIVSQDIASALGLDMIDPQSIFITIDPQTFQVTDLTITTRFIPARILINPSPTPSPTSSPGPIIGP